MKNNEILSEIKEALQMDDELNVDMLLEDIEEWDSLAIISIASLYEQLFSKIISSDEIKACVTVGDLINLSSTND